MMTEVCRRVRRSTTKRASQPSRSRKEILALCDPRPDILRFPRGYLLVEQSGLCLYECMGDSPPQPDLDDPVLRLSVPAAIALRDMLIGLRLEEE
jgi:hypothetical protein